MQKFLSSIPFMCLPALALAQEEAAHAPSETVSLVYVAVFLVLFVGSIVGFFIYLWMNERRKKQGQ